MPYTASLDFRSMSGLYVWDPQLATKENHMAELQNLFRRNPEVTPARLRKIMSDNFQKPDRFFRTSAERKAARQLTQQMQAKMFNHLVSTAFAMKECRDLPNAPTVFSKLGRAGFFIRNDLNNPDTMVFNKKLIDAAMQHDENPGLLAKIIIDELTELRNKLGLDDPENIKKLGTLTDAEVVEKFDDLIRYQQIMLEVGDSPDTDWIFTKDQLAQIKEQYNQMEYLQNFSRRCSAIANPYYEDINFDRLFEQGIKTPPFFAAAEKYIPNYSASNKQDTLNVFFENAQISYTFFPIGLAAHVGALKPELTETLKPTKARHAVNAALAMGSPYVAVGSDNKEYVLTNHITADKVPTAQEYTNDLLDRALESDKWLLTGSKQFDAMLKELKELKRMDNSTGSIADTQFQVQELAKAATAYLKYKDEHFTAYMGPTSVHGKNMREQTRLEVAGEILNYAMSRVPSLQLVKDNRTAKYNQREADLKAHGRPKSSNTKGRALKEAHVDVISAEGRQKFFNKLGKSITNLLSREVPMEDLVTVVRLGPNPDDPTDETHKFQTVMDQSEFSSLCALAAASKSARFRPTYQKGYVFNENAEQTYKDMMTAIFASQDIKSVPKELSNMLSGIMSTAAHSVKERKYETLGKMLADGLKRNNEIMQAQKTFTPEFYICGKLTANLLTVMDKIDPLKAAVEKHLDKNDLQIAKACKGVYDVIADGITAYNNLEARFNMDDDARAFSESRSVNDKGILDEMARLSHMYGMEALFVNGHLTLDANCDYGKIPGYGGKTSEALRQTQTIDNFVESLKGKTQEERLAIIKNPHEMTALFQNSLTAASNVIDQAIQPVPQINKDLQKQEPEIPPAQIGSPNSLG